MKPYRQARSKWDGERDELARAMSAALLAGRPALVAAERERAVDVVQALGGEQPLHRYVNAICARKDKP